MGKLYQRGQEGINLQARHQFTMQTEKEGRLPFLDVMVTRKPNGALLSQ